MEPGAKRLGEPITLENCEEKLRLLVAYQTATEVYSKAVAELVAKIGITPKAEYDALNGAAEQSRYASMDARDRLERHTTEHG